MLLSNEHTALSMSNEIEFLDITPEVSELMAVWPGDQPFIKKTIVDFDSGSNYRLASIQTTLHLGAHTDAPNHYHSEGRGIEARNLNYYMGTCQVISVSLPRHSRILVKDILEHSICAERVLFKTLSFPDPNNWNTDFNSLSEELVNYLSERKVKLVGIDTPSIDLFDDRDLQSHKAIYQCNMAILEGIVLKHVPDGVYTLVALPLKIRDADASPVRAVLFKNKGN